MENIFVIASYALFIFQGRFALKCVLQSTRNSSWKLIKMTLILLVCHIVIGLCSLGISMISIARMGDEYEGKLAELATDGQNSDILGRGKGKHHGGKNLIFNKSR